MAIDRARDVVFEGQVIDHDSTQRLELWVRGAGLLDGLDVFLGGALIAGSSDGRIHAFPIDRRTELSAVLVRFHGRQGGTSAIVDVTGEAKKLQERSDHSYLIRGV
jgi:hypothetical protein